LGSTAFGVSFGEAPAHAPQQRMSSSFHPAPAASFPASFDGGFVTNFSGPPAAPSASGFAPPAASFGQPQQASAGGFRSLAGTPVTSAFSTAFDDDFGGIPLPAPAPAPAARPTPPPPRPRSTSHITPMTAAELAQYHSLFDSVAAGAIGVTRSQANDVFNLAQLPADEVDLIWVLNDLDMDGKLNVDEFAVALHIAAARYKGAPLPDEKPNGLIPPQVAAEVRNSRDSRASVASSCGSSGMRESSGGSSSAVGRWRASGNAARVSSTSARESPREGAAGGYGGGGHSGGGSYGGGGGGIASRSGMLRHQSKARWCVLGGGFFALYKAQTDKTPQLQLSLRTDVQRVWQSNMSTFSIILDPNRPGAKPKKVAAVGPPEKLELTADNPSELTAWIETLQVAIAACK
jgi:hypothetical protein